MITPTKVEPTTSDAHIAGTASGVWSAQDQLEAKRGGAWPDASVANPDSLVENNFSTFLYTANATTRTITNNINLSGKGGLVWTKARSGSDAHVLYDTERGTSVRISTNDADGNTTDTNEITAFNSNGYTLNSGGGFTNDSPTTYVSWTFKKAPKFFDVVTYTGNDTAGRTIAHSLGSVPGMILIKNLTDADNWMVYHRGLNGGTSPENYYTRLNLTNAEVNDTTFTNGTAPTSSVFSVSNHSTVNGDNKSYVAYVFAHETGSDSMIQCGSYTHPNDTSTVSVDLGWEPQWILFKANQASTNWYIFDTMRGIVEGGLSGDGDAALFSNLSNAENVNTWGVDVKPTGFNSTGNNIGSGGNTVIYVAIRRPNMATITDATKVFAVDAGNGAIPEYTAGFVVDFAFYKELTSSDDWEVHSRLQGNGKSLNFNSTAAEGTDTGTNLAKFNLDNVSYQGKKDEGSGFIAWMWKRAKGYFDVVAYTGTGSAKTEAHGLGVAPEMIWVKSRSHARVWRVYHTGIAETHSLSIDDNDAKEDDDTIWNDTAPTSSVFTVGADNSVNNNNYTYIAFLFATLAGVSKVGSVTHSGSSTDVDCGFTAGARLVMLKRTDATGDWYWWDSTNGIIAGNDPYLLLNDTAAQVTNTDYIDPLASGFQISGDFTDGDYIFYAIA